MSEMTLNKVTLIFKDGRVVEMEGKGLDCGSMDGAVMIRMLDEACDIKSIVYPLADVAEVTYLVGMKEEPQLEVVGNEDA